MRLSYLAAMATGAFFKRSAARALAAAICSLVSPMKSSPFAAKLRQVLDKRVINLVQFPPLETIVLAQFRGAIRTMQFEYHLASVSDHMDVRRPMIVGKNNYYQTAETQYFGHCHRTQTV
jgi:hypothetical protein